MNKLNVRANPLGRVALLISLYFPPEPGGGATTALNRASILHKIGYTVFVLCGFPTYPNGKVTEDKYKGKFFYVEKLDCFTLIRLRLLPLKSKGYIRRFILIVNFVVLTLVWFWRISKISSKPQLVYALAPILFSSFIGSVYSKLTKSFFIYEISAFWPEELIALKTRSYFIISCFGEILARVSYYLPDMLIVISDLAALYLKDKYQPRARVYPLHIGVDPRRYPLLSKQSSRKKLIENKILPSDFETKFIILYSGVVTKITKVENLIHAANKLKHSSNDIAFLVVGEGEEKKKLESLKLCYGLKNLLLLPFQENKFVPYLVSAADVCVVPLSSEPIYETTVPTKFFDYLACFKPQLGICTGELASIINSHKIGLTVKDGQVNELVGAIITLKNSPSLIQSMEKNTHSVLEFFSLDTLALRLDDALKKETTR